MNTVSVLWLRQMKRYKRSGVRMVLSVVQRWSICLRLGLDSMRFFSKREKEVISSLLCPE
jgi:hypothetical protein